MLTMQEFNIAKVAASTTKIRKEIAVQFGCSVSAVSFHMRKIYRFFGIAGAGSRLQLITLYANTRDKWQDYPAFVKWKH